MSILGLNFCLSFLSYLFYGRYYYVAINIETKVSSYGCPDLAMAINFNSKNFLIFIHKN
ncbi:MAG: hypothetical protein ACI8WT_005063 [Clostridium sp.]